MKVELKKKPIIYPCPALMIGTYNPDGSEDVMMAAWGGIHDDNELYICLSEDHRTAKNILERKAFTIAFATVEELVASDYVGIVSGNKEKDKFKKAGFTASKSNKVDAPIIDNYPLTVELTLKSYDKGLIVGNIEGVIADDSILTDGRVDLGKFHPVMFDPDNNTYHEIGKKVGKAFSDGLELR